MSRDFYSYAHRENCLKLWLKFTLAGIRILHLTYDRHETSLRVDSRIFYYSKLELSFLVRALLFEELGYTLSQLTIR